MNLHLVHERLAVGGLLLATLKSTRADSFGMGTEIEPGTFVRDSWREAGVPHHFFDEDGIRSAFARWKLQSLVELRCDYAERPQDGV